MSFYEFLNLEELQQVAAFWNGSFIGRRSHNGLEIECRQIHNFYIEYMIFSGHYIDMCGFTNPDLLQPYLEQIDISKLVDL